MGGLFDSGSDNSSQHQAYWDKPQVQDNSGQINSSLMEMNQMAGMQAEQNALMMQQYQQTALEQNEANAASMEQESMLAAKEALEAAELEERRYRMAKGKKDLLYKNALGASDSDDEEEDQPMLKLGGNY